MPRTNQAQGLAHFSVERKQFLERCVLRVLALPAPVPLPRPKLTAALVQTIDAVREAVIEAVTVVASPFVTGAVIELESELQPETNVEGASGDVTAAAFVAAASAEGRTTASACVTQLDQAMAVVRAAGESSTARFH